MKPEPQIHGTPAAPDAAASAVSASRSWLSALADGDAQAAQHGCTAWRDDADARRTWHLYQLIGDTLRSEDLASTSRRDAAFLAGVRARLAAEPVVLAPAPAPAVRRRQPWLVPAAAAAGFAAVAGVLIVARFGAPSGGWTDVGVGPVAVSAPSASSAQLQTVSTPMGRSLRDPRIDEMLRAHAAAGGRGVALIAPGNVLRPAELTITTVTPDR